MKPIVRGDSRTVKVVITDDADLAVNISGHTLWATLKANLTDVDVDAAFQGSAVMPSNAESLAGIGYITIDATGITPGRYHYDIQWVQPGPVVRTIEIGVVRIKADVTQSIS